MKINGIYVSQHMSGNLCNHLKKDRGEIPASRARRSATRIHIIDMPISVAIYACFLHILLIGRV